MKNVFNKFVFIFLSLLSGQTLLANEVASSSTDSNFAFYAIAAAISIALPAMGGALGQGKAAAAALEGIARNPEASGKIFVPMILGMALIESLVLFGLIFAFILSGKIL